MKRISFVCIDFPDGQALVRRTNGLYEFWFISDGCGDMVYQFGCSCYSMNEFIKLVRINYDSGNVVKQS